MKQNYEVIARKIILMTYQYIDSRDQLLKKSILNSLKDLAKVMNVSIKESNKYRIGIKDALCQFIDPNNGYNETINKLYNIVNKL